MGTDKVNRKSERAELDRSTSKGVGAMRKDEFVVKFSDRDAFGKFCSALHGSDVPFSLLGFQTVAIRGKSGIQELPPDSRTLLSSYASQKTAELLPAMTATPRTRRRPITPEEASQLFQERAKKYT